ncbi:MAG: hypothetical protein AB7W16_28660 [Candidatus Obscuribacterales bacterium]
MRARTRGKLGTTYGAIARVLLVKSGYGRKAMDSRCRLAGVNALQELV